METFSTLLALREGNPPVIGGFPSQRPMVRSFDVSFDLRLNKRLSKQSRRWWFQTPWSSLWRDCNGNSQLQKILRITWIQNATHIHSNVGPIHLNYRAGTKECLTILQHSPPTNWFQSWAYFLKWKFPKLSTNTYNQLFACSVSRSSIFKSSQRYCASLSRHHVLTWIVSSCCDVPKSTCCDSVADRPGTKLRLWCCCWM